MAAAPFGTPAAIAGGRPPPAILTAAGVTNIATTLGNNNNKQECNGSSNQQAVIVQQPPVTATLFNNSNGHHPMVNFSSSPSITLIPASPATATSTLAINSPVNLSGVTVTPTTLPTLSSASTSSTTMTPSTLATAIVMPTQPAVSVNPTSLSAVNSTSLSSVTVSLSTTTSEKLQQFPQPSQLSKLPSAVVSINPSPAVTVIPTSEALNQGVQVGSIASRNNIAHSVEVRPIRDNEQPESKKPRLENQQTQ